MLLTHLRPDTPVCRSILAEPGRWCTDHCKETRRTQSQGRWLNLNQIWLTEWKSYLVLSVTQYTSILVTHTCLGWGNPCLAGCSPVCCPGWRQQSNTGLWLGWPTPAGPPAWSRETRGCERQKGEAWVKWMYFTCRFFSSLKLPIKPNRSVWSCTVQNIYLGHPGKTKSGKSMLCLQRNSETGCSPPKGPHFCSLFHMFQLIYSKCSCSTTSFR